MTRVRGWCPTCGCVLWTVLLENEGETLYRDGTCALCSLRESRAAWREVYQSPFREEYRGREHDANLYAYDLGPWQAIAVDGERAAHDVERHIRATSPRAIIEEGPEPGSEEVRGLFRQVRALLDEANGDETTGTDEGADERIGHTVPPILRPAYDGEGWPLREERR